MRLNEFTEQPVDEGVAEGEVKQFPKKHRGDLEDTHSCVKCGGDLQGGTYMGHKVKVCQPCKQVYLPPNTGIDQRGNKVDEQGAAEGTDDPWGDGHVRGAAAGTMNAPHSKYPEGSKDHKLYMIGYKQGVTAYNNKVKQYKKSSKEQSVAEGDPGYDKHSFVGKIRRGREADNKGWGQLGQLFAADNEKDAEKALRKGNRYYNMTRGNNKTPGGFPKTTVEEHGVAEAGGRDSWDSNMPGYQGDYGGAENWGRRNREDDEHHEIDRRMEQEREHRNTHGTWYVRVDGQVIPKPYKGKAAANAAALEFKKQPGNENKVIMLTIREQ